MPWDEGLQGQALQIAATPNSPLCVVAGPGTGKTFALMRRLTRLLEVGQAVPGRILACTFTRTAAEDITRSISQLGVTAHSFFGEQLLDGDPTKLGESEAQQAMALLALLSNPGDRVALRCWCGFGSNSLSDGAWSRLRTYCESIGDSPWRALEKLTTDTLQLPHTSYIVARFETLQALIATLSGATGQALVAAVLPSTESWGAPFVEIASSLEQDDFGPKELGDALRRSIAQPEMPTDVDYVRIMSLYKSKGLTADLVVVCGCLQSLIPSTEAAAPQEQHRTIEEQRRLFYVAITRTRQTLVVSSVTGLLSASAFKMRAHTRQTIGGTTQTVASQFIHELGSQCPAAVTGQQFGVLTSGKP